MLKKTIKLVIKWFTKVSRIRVARKYETGAPIHMETLSSELQKTQPMESEIQQDLERDLATIEIGERVLMYLSQQYQNQDQENQEMSNKVMVSLSITKTLQEMKKAEDRVTQNLMKQ